MLYSFKDYINDTWINILRGSRFIYFFKKKRKKSGAVFQFHTASYFLYVFHDFSEAIPSSFTREPSPHLLGVVSQVFLYSILHFVHHVSLLWNKHIYKEKKFYQNNTPYTLHAVLHRKEYKLSWTESVKYFNPHGETSNLFLTIASNQASLTTKYHLSTCLLMQSHIETLTLVLLPTDAHFMLHGSKMPELSVKWENSPVRRVSFQL